MIVKAVTLFLIGMGVLAMFGRLRIPMIKKRTKIASAKYCPKCGTPLPQKGQCPCSKG